MNNHTPAPWRADGTYIKTPTGERIAYMANRDEQALADARLIAAAPELLEALMSILDYELEMDLCIASQYGGESFTCVGFRGYIADAKDTFALVALDPPHLVRAGPRSWLAAKYGKLSDDWRADLRQGFVECFRVLRPEGVLVFKWNETQVPLREVLALTPEKPLFGQQTGRSQRTHWLVFMK